MPNIIDIGNIGLAAAIQFAPRENGTGKRAYDVFRQCFWNGILVRTSGDMILLSPPLIIDKLQIEQIVDSLEQAILSAG